MVFFSPLGEPLLNPYTVLGIEFGASDDDIAKAYKKLMLQLHPDKQPADQSAEEAEEVSRQFHDVMGAKSFLLDGEHLASRREYDARLIAKEKADAAAAAREAAEAKMRAEQAAARAKAQQEQQQQQSAPSATQSPSKVSSPTPQPPPSTTKPTYNKAESNKADANKRYDTSKKPNITKKQWGRVSRPVRRTSFEEPTKMERKGSGSTTSEDLSSDNEGPESSRTRRRKKSQDNEHKSCNITRSKHNNKEKKSPSSSNKPCKDGRKDSSSKKTSHKRSHAICSKDKKPSSPNKTTSTKKTSNKGSVPTHHKTSSPITKKVIPESNRKQRPKSGTGSADHKFSNSCPSLFDDDEMKSKSAAFVRKSSVGGRAQGTIKPTETTTKSGTSPKARAPSSFETFQPAVETLTKQYICPLTKEIMKEPMTDFEGNSYEREAILKYLETHSSSPVTGNPLCPLHLTTNSAMRERIQYTLKLKICLDVLNSKEKSSPTSGQFTNENNVQTSQQCHFKPLSLRQSVDMFIKEVNSASPNGIINRLDSSGNASFVYKGRDYTLQVPEGLSHNVIVQTWFEHDRKAAGISARVVEWNRKLQEVGIGGQLTFRNMKGKFAFTLAREMKAENFCKRDLKHVMEYYLEFSIKLHNIINVTDQIKVDKVRLQDSSFAQ